MILSAALLYGIETVEQMLHTLRNTSKGTLLSSVLNKA